MNKISAETYTDDHRIEVKSFDATPWFEEASDEEIEQLIAEEYGGNYTADSVAEKACEYDQCVADMFTYLEALPRGIDLRGFECHVDEEQARAWIAANRPHIPLE